MAHDAASDSAPELLDYPLLPLKNVVVFPRTIVNLTIGRSRSVHALNTAMSGNRCVVVIAQKSPAQHLPDDEPGPADLYDIGTLVEVRQVRRQPPGPDQGLQVEVEALRRVRLVSTIQEEPCLVGTFEILPDKVAVGKPGKDAESLASHLTLLFDQYAALNNNVPSEAPDHIRAARQPGYLADLLAAHLLSDVHERQKVLEIADQSERLNYMSSVLVNALDQLQTEQRVRDKVRASIDKNQREFYLREQLKAIHDELASDGGNEISELRDRLEAKGMPADILQRMIKEVNRLERMPSISPESTVLRNYIDWALALPWSERNPDRIDLPLAEQILEDDHYGLENVKERILDYLAVRQLTTRKNAFDLARADNDNKRAKPATLDGVTANHSDTEQSKIQNPKSKMAAGQGSILCFVGPPGVGKTSLGQSIARAMGREFVRLSLGGVHDESEIRGHRRTYVGAMPGRIIQAMKTAGSMNPVMLLDEVDKMTSDMRGDPAAAMLEVLDPAQNYTFTDHYLDVPYDLSDVLFIATGNTLYNIPKPLRDRMEVIEIGGYTEEEKVQIARRHLLPRQVDLHGLEQGFLEIPDRMLRDIIRTHTREAGVRELDRKLATVCRKAARKVVQGRTTRVRVTGQNLEEFLGAAKFRSEVESRHDQVGVAMGLAWTEHGGELLPVEVALMPGHGALTITGRLGDIMQESARAALSFARSRAEQLHIDLDSLDKSDLHIHLPEGAIPKDGPSAGITMATALISAITRRPVRSNMGMTGEITLTGRVLAIGGLKEKALAVHRAGIKTILAPASNKPEWSEMPATVKRELEFIWVETMDQVIDIALYPVGAPPAVPVAAQHAEADTAQEEKGKRDRIRHNPHSQDAPTLHTSPAATRAAAPRPRKSKKTAGDPNLA
ncbi:MAG TPA: endopeptidase La [Chloroflexia bacterium]|nr:endopeptidase La [Chloroflexia bacterium]